MILAKRKQLNNINCPEFMWILKNVERSWKKGYDTLEKLSRVILKLVKKTDLEFLKLCSFV